MTALYNGCALAEWRTSGCGQSPLHFAAVSATNSDKFTSNVIDMLLQKGADPDSVAIVIDMLGNDKQRSSSKQQAGRVRMYVVTPLLAAISHRNIAAVRTLLFPERCSWIRTQFPQHQSNDDNTASTTGFGGKGGVTVKKKNCSAAADPNKGVLGRAVTDELSASGQFAEWIKSIRPVMNGTTVRNNSLKCGVLDLLWAQECESNRSDSRFFDMPVEQSVALTSSISKPNAVPGLLQSPLLLAVMMNKESAQIVELLLEAGAACNLVVASSKTESSRRLDDADEQQRQQQLLGGDTLVDLARSSRKYDVLQVLLRYERCHPSLILSSLHE